MKKRCLSLFLALTLVFALLPAQASAALTYDPTTTPIRTLLPTDLRRPAIPTTLEQLTWYVHDAEGWNFPQSRESVFQEIIDLTDSLTAGKSSDREKMKAIYDWVSTNISYADRDEEGGTFGAYVMRATQCWGYAGLCRLMGTLAGLTVATVDGISNEANPGLHAWNAVLLDGKWLFFDATWSLWDMDENYHHWAMAECYDDIYEWDIRGGSGKHQYPDELIFTVRRGFEEQCPASVAIPDTVTEVTNFYGCPDLERVTFPNTVTKISGFGRCAKLKSVSLPNSLIEIGNSAFNECTGLTGVTIPNSVTVIDYGAFANSGLKSVTVPGSVTKIGTGAFNGCTDLTSVTIGRGVTAIGDLAFMGCTALTDVTIPNTVTSIEKQAFMDCTALERITIPEGVATIEQLAFFGCTNLRSADLPNSITSIDGTAFSECPNLPNRTTIPAGVTEIEAYAFRGNTELTSMVIPDHITKIGYQSFKDCTNLRSVTIPNSVTSIELWAFSGCSSLQSVTLPSSITSIDGYVFDYCSSLKSITIPGSVTSIGDSAFRMCKGLTDINLPAGVTSIGKDAFAGCVSLSDLTIPDRVTSIGAYAFYNCAGLESIAIPQGVANIGEFTFNHCTGLKQVGIPHSVTSIGDWAFEDCASLKDVYYTGTEAQWKAISMGRNNEALTSATIHYNSAGTQPRETKFTANPTNDTLKVDGKSQVPTAYKIGDANYFQLRDVAMLLSGTKAQFSVDYDAERQAVIIVTGQPYKPLGTELAGAAKDSAEAILGNNDIYINGKKVDFAVYKINGANFFQIRALGQALGFNVGWTAQQGMFIESDKPYDPSN